ncbi:MAG: FAD binding domain-containing protein [Pseudomonadota bacterium]|nr:FAD binding domain-containing protein [Pseudomonadota bacterium]
MKWIALDGDRLTIGAGASYSDCQTHLAEHFPDLRAYWNRIAGWQVRNMGTIGGNIANGSPIGDTPPVLIALGAEITLRHGATRRAIPLEDFFIAYGRQDRTPGEFVEEIAVPLPGQGQRDAAYKISKRRDEDISSLPAGISGTVANGVISACCIAFGGMAGTPKRALTAEEALIGQPWCEGAFTAAAPLLPQNFTPLSDWRASADYRMLTAQNLLLRFFLEQDDAGGEPVRLAVA